MTRPILQRFTRRSIATSLRYRQVNVLAIDEPLRPVTSAYDFDSELPQLIANRDRAQAVLREIEATTSEARLKREAASWYQL